MTINVTSTSWAPGTLVTVTVESTPVIVAVQPANDTGFSSINVTLPADLAPGHHALIETGTAPDGSPQTQSTPFTVVARARPATATAPGAPSGLTATPGNTTATLTWTAPPSDGGSSITGYLITPSNGPTVSVGDVTRDTIAGLIDGTDYTFTVAAINAIGTGPNSMASASVTPYKATSKTTFKLSASKVTYGHEKVEHLSVTVSLQKSGLTPTGTVTVWESTKTLCVIKLTSGTGSCRLSNKRLKTNTYHLVVTYGGSATIIGSTSIKETLIVAK